MPKLVWDQSGDRLFETGIDRGVLYLSGGIGVAWNGLTAVNESPSGGEPSSIYADNIKYLTLMSAEEFKATVEAYTYPDEFKQCLGQIEITDGVTIFQQTRKPFNLCYRTLVGNDEEGTDYGYKIHIVYGCLASPTDASYSTVNDSPDAVSFSWEINATPVEVGDDYKPTATVVLNSRDFKDAGLWNVLQVIENSLYGTSSANSKVLSVSQITTICESYCYLMDSDGDYLLDSDGNYMQSMVYS